MKAHHFSSQIEAELKGQIVLTNKENERLRKQLVNVGNENSELKNKVEKLTKEIAELKKWHYTKEGDHPTTDGEYQVIVELNNHRGVYVTTCDNWDCDLQVFTESCYPENIVAWAELSLQPDDLEDHL